MTDKLRSWIAPAYLLLCLLLGGSAQGIWANAILQLVAVAIIAWAVLDMPVEPLPRPARQLCGLIALAFGAVLIQLVPLPPAVWSALPGRGVVHQGFALLGVSTGWMPISLAPYDTAEALLALLPPAAMVAAILGFRRPSPTLLALAIVVGAFAGVMLGVLQVSSGGAPASPWYLYEISNFGVATGFFANSNHMASLLLVSIPFVVAIGAARAQVDDSRKRYMALALTAGGLLVALTGLLLNGSLSGFGLLWPVLASSTLVLARRTRRLVRTVLVACAVGLAAAAMVLFTPLGERLSPAGTATSLSTRQEMAAIGATAFRQFFPVGSGVGTFPKVYRTLEDPAAVDRTYVNNAHNDYLEIAVEAGIVGIALVFTFLLWWSARVWRILQSPASDRFAVAGVVASAAVLLHSLVDYPLRTAAISATFATCLALMLVSRQRPKGQPDLRPTRHLVIG